MIETLISLLSGGIIAEASSRGLNAIIDSLKKHFGNDLSDKVGRKFKKSYDLYLKNDNKIIGDYPIDDPYYRKLLYNFNLEDGESLPDHFKELSKFFLLELLSDKELWPLVLNAKIDDISKSVADIKKNMVTKSDIVKLNKSNAELCSNIKFASVDLSSYENTFHGKIHIDRVETKDIYNWLISELKFEESNISVLSGNAGYGKSVVLRDLYDLLTENEIPTLGIKVDKVLNISSIKDIESELNIVDGIIPTLELLNRGNELVVLLIDQVDALSQSLSSNRNAMNIYDRLIKQLKGLTNIRIVISCRNYDLDYDPTLRSYKGKNIFKLSLLELEQVDSVLHAFGINVSDNQVRLKEFLRIPLHLNLFCKIGLERSFKEDITLSKLYDAIWDKYIFTDESNSIISLLTDIANKMNEQQHIVVDKRAFDFQKKELDYLMHHELLKNSSGDKIQFLHQTFFDYVYARTFISSGKDISEWLKSVHQGLFIRSQVKQIFSYLRDIDIDSYINSLKKILPSNEYRFHLKLLIINDLGFCKNPTDKERKFVVDNIITCHFYFELFLESIQSPEWFAFIIEREEFKSLMSKGDDRLDRLIINLCLRVIWQNAELVHNFLSIVSYKVNIIESVLYYMQDSCISMSFDLYQETSSKWANDYYKYGFLEKSLKLNPDFAIEELKKNFHLRLSEIDYFGDSYIPGGHSGLDVYEKVFNLYPNKAIPFFLYTIEEILKRKSYDIDDTFCGSMAFSHFRPDDEKEKDFYGYKDLYSALFHAIKNKKLDENSISLIKETLSSKYGDMITFGIFYLLQNKDTEIDLVFELLTKPDFIARSSVSELLRYYTNLLLSECYPLFNEVQQVKINQIILFTSKRYSHWDYEEFYTKRKVCSNYLKNTYSLISLLPDELINKYSDLKKVFQEGERKYGKIENEQPSIISATIGDKSYSSASYDKMTLTNWRNSFLKRDKEYSSPRDWDLPTKRGNASSFEAYVSKDPDKFYTFIESLVDDMIIHVDYVLAGLEGLKKGNYCRDSFQILCVKAIVSRKKDLEESALISFLRILEYITLNNEEIDKLIVDFVIEVIKTYPDRDNSDVYRNNDSDGIEIVNLGINSTRGIAVGLLISCGSSKKYKDIIFETLEYIADTANEVTRSCAIFRSAWLLNLDKLRAFNLYLRLVKDYNIHLLSLPFDDSHPLYYMINIDFDRLIPLFNKSITINEAAQPMSFFLLRAYILNKEESFELLSHLIENVPSKMNNLVWTVCTELLNGKNSDKGWNIFSLLLRCDDKVLGESINNLFLKIPRDLSAETTSFIQNYLESPLVKYRGNYFYEFLRELIVYDPKQCLEWFFLSNPNIVNINFYDDSPLNVLIEAYNGVREYDKNSELLEESMDCFDSLLKIYEYRNKHLRTFLKELEV